MAYMPNIGEAVLFGGIDLHGDRLDDTWTWSNGCWRLANPAHKPRLDIGTAAFDEKAGRVLLYYPGSVEGVSAETWSWDGNDWVKVADGPTILRSERSAVAAFDVGSGRVMLFGALSSAGASQTWTWNGTSWEAMSPLHSPMGRTNAAMAYDPSTHKILLFGGRSVLNYRALNDTWAWDGKDWMQLNPPNSPPAREGAAMTSFSAKSQMVLIGGWDTSVFSDAWVWDGRTWIPSSAPGPRQNAVAVDVGPQVLVFGGTSQATANTDTWDGHSWAAS